MRSIVLVASLTLASATVAQAQQAQSLQNANSPSATGDFVPKEVAVVSSAQAPSLRLVDAPIGMTRAQAGVNASSNAMTAASAASVDPGTRNMLAIIGAVVVVVALLAFLL